MKKILQLLAILTLLIWGGLFLQFYISGRIEKYLDPSFRIYALLSGTGFLLLGAFNFFNRNRETGVCTHDHAHGETCQHDHHHDHAEEHEEEHAHACDHKHGHSCGHDHACGHDHDHDHGCDHDHHHDEHEPHGCCGHGHDHDHAEHVHTHDHEDSTSGVAFSLLVLLIPLLVATAYSQDRFSSDYVAKWGKIERQMMQKRIADSRNAAGKSPDAPVTNPYTREGIESAEGVASTGTPAAGQPNTPPEPDAKAAEAWGTFTMEDLKKMVPQNDKGEFLLDVPQIFYTAGDKELMDVMEGIPVETTAQLMEETLNNPNNTRLKAFRLFIECCAADARPLSVPVDFGQAPPDYTEMGWYKLYGKLHYAKENDEIIPMIRIERIESTTEPTDGLLF